MSVTSIAGVADLPERARSVATIADKHAEEGDRNGQLSQPVVDALHRERLLAMWVPQSLGGAELDVTIGDIAETRVEGSFSLVYLVANTIMNLTTQDEQVACFENASAHLRPGGRFLIEVIVPGWQRLPPGERYQAFDVRPDHLGFDEIDVVTQGSFSHHYWIEDGTVQFVSTPFRYVWPAELDLMARIAGMSLCERWGGWSREPFTSDSRKHVSVWEKA